MPSPKRWLVAIIALALVSACDGKSKLTRINATVAEWLDACSPFVSFDGQQMMLFDFPKHTVVLETADGPDKAEGALTAKNLTKAHGTWTVQEDTKRVFVDFGDLQRGYLLVIPFDQDVCMLVIGRPNAVDLRRAWFGTPDFSD
jgi:hypothetical protein